MRSSSGGSGGGDAHSRALITTRLSAVDLLDHYARQLTAAGWRSTGRAQDTGLGVQGWRFTDDEGAAWFGVLAVVRHPEGGRYQLLLQVGTDAEDRRG